MKPSDSHLRDAPVDEHGRAQGHPADDSLEPDEFASSLAAYHEALVAGLIWEDLDVTLPLEESAMSEELEKARHCVRLLHEFWPVEETASTGSGRQDGTSDSDVSSVEKDRRRLGRFEILRKLGQGAHGVVFLARDTTLDRNVALKIPRPEVLLTAQLRRRFLREARAASSLNHPNLACVYETGEVGPVCYIAQEYCPGPTLATWIEERTEPVEPPLAAALIAVLAEAVDYAHRCGVLHRDLKPGNVILEPRPEEALPAVPSIPSLPFLPRIADFGLAKLIEQEGNETRSGMLLGTPLYMAPEQAEGKLEEIVPATDVYALGVILYELLTGRTPFQGKSGIEAIRHIVADDPAPLRRIRRDVPRDLEAICLKCLERDASQRYSTAASLASDLHRFLSGEPTVARPLGLWHRLFKFGRRRPALAGLVAVSTTALLALLVGGWWHAASLQALLTEVDQQRKAALHQESLARERELRVRHYLYAGDMSHAFSAWSNRHAAEARQLLERHLPESVTDSDLRTFPWYHLWRIAHGDRLTLHGHDGDVHAVAWSPDGRKLATASHDGTARIWNAATGEQLAVLLEGQTDELNAIAFSPDGTLIATGSDDRVVRLWDSAAAEQRATLVGHQNSVYAVAFSPDGNTLASGGPDHVVKLWEIGTSKELATLAGHSGAVEAIAFSPTGKILASASGDGTAIVWDLLEGKPVFTLQGHDNVLRAVAFSHDGRVLATGSDDRTIRLWDTATGEIKAKLTGHGEIVQNVAFSPIGPLLAASVKDGTVQIWDYVTGLPVRRIMGHSGRVWSTAFSSDGAWLASSSGDGTVKVWNVTEDSSRLNLGSSQGTVLSLSFLSGGEQLAAIFAPHDANGGEIKTWSLDLDAGSATAFPPRPLHCEDGVVRDGAFLPDGDTVALAFTAHLEEQRKTPQLCLFDFSTGRSSLTYTDPVVGQGKEFIARCLACASERNWLAVGRDGGLIDLWHASDVHHLRTLHGHTDTINALVFSPDGRHLVSASEDQTVRFWSLDPPAERFLSRQHRSGVCAATCSPDGSIVATAGLNQTLILWDFATAEVLATLHAPDKPLKLLAFSHSGMTLAAGTADGTLRLWDVSTRQEVGTWRAHERSVNAMAFSHDDRLLATAGRSADGRSEIVVWRAD